MIAAEKVLELQNLYPHISLEAAIPCYTQMARWSKEQRTRYFDILELCDKKTRVGKEYTPDCMRKRNEYMVDSSDIVMAVWDGKPGGTHQTVQYALEKKKAIVFINANDLSVVYRF
ncbi:MAG: DUF1273 family protein [Clostridia bacterium]|nr:DUF1273 family protein [Clostridia bacterium]